MQTIPIESVIYRENPIPRVLLPYQHAGQSAVPSCEAPRAVQSLLHSIHQGRIGWHAELEQVESMADVQLTAFFNVLLRKAGDRVVADEVLAWRDRVLAAREAKRATVAVEPLAAAA